MNEDIQKFIIFIKGFCPTRVIHPHVFLNGWYCSEHIKDLRYFEELGFIKDIDFESDYTIRERSLYNFRLTERGQEIMTEYVIPLVNL